MQFRDIIGQEDIASHLRQGVRSGRVSHAQLFGGKAGYGGYALALAYLQYLMCESPSEEDSCGVCAACRQCESMTHPDVHFVMPVNRQGKKSGQTPMSSEFLPLWRELSLSSGGYLSPSQWSKALDLGKTLSATIAAKEADSIISQLALKSYSGGYKVVIIWQPEAMNESAANKILKVLEEPYPQTLFLLISEQPQLLLPTILSRTQAVTIPPIAPERLVEWLASNGVGESGNHRGMARLSGGDVIELRDIAKGDRNEQREQDFELFTSVMRLSYNDKHLELIEWAQRVATLPRQGQTSFLRYSSALLREAYIMHAGLSQISYLWGEEEDFCRKFSPFIGSGNIERLIQEIEQALVELRHNTNPSILFTHFALKISKDINRL
ncbi:MAG: DNA polymerase III subunit delta [Rikenellaceae bacterium]